jgi:ABC-type transport system involved in cytochrome bd biosynthesis fused ATPase/permease subunit
MHTHPFYLALYIIACICFILATFNAPLRINLIAAGLLAAVLVPTLTLLQS